MSEKRIIPDRDAVLNEDELWIHDLFMADLIVRYAEDEGVDPITLERRQ
jgi:hypothetical protein